MSRASIISRARFNAINREIKKGIPVVVIAHNYRVSQGTVRNIRAARTWPEWERRKEAIAKKALARRRAKEVAPAETPKVTWTDDGLTAMHKRVMDLKAEVNELEKWRTDVEKWIKVRQDIELAETLERRPRRFSLWRTR